MRRPLALRSWLLAAVAVLVTLPVAVAAGTWLGVAAWQHAQDRSRTRQALALIEAGRGHWTEPAWQARARRQLAELGVEAQVVTKEIGGPGTISTASSAGAGVGVVTPVGAKGTDVAAKQKAARDGSVFTTPGMRDEGATTKSEAAEHTSVTTLVVGDGQAVAAVLRVPPASAAVRIAATLGAGLAVLIAALVAISLGLRRFVAAPLGALADGAERIAGGDLDVGTPRSPVREIDQVAGAMRGMSGSLRASTRRDARAEHDRRFLISAVAHDLRTPLFTLRGYLEGMERGMDDGTYVARARDKADLLDRLVSDLFAYSRWELLDEPPRREPIELGEVARRAAGTVAERARERDVAIAPDGPPLTLAADEHLLTRVFANLLDNAVRHSPPGGAVDVDWRRVNGSAVVEVADRGPGLEPDDLARAFEPLYRGDAARNSSTGGAGLGLAIARKLVEAHGGRVTAANRPGGGACFTVTLPVDA